jgi:hypothetical protein
MNTVEDRLRDALRERARYSPIDGKQYGAQTFAAWRGSGLRLWAFSVPTHLYTSADPRMDVLMGYDAAGHVVWQMRLGSGG